MARQKTMYKLAGRYVRGNDTVYYALLADNGKEVKYTEEQMAFAVGREQVINVSAQLYKDKVVFRGIGCDIRELPVVQVNEKVGQTNKNNNKPVIKPVAKPATQPVKPVAKPATQPVKPVAKPARPAPEIDNNTRNKQILEKLKGALIKAVQTNYTLLNGFKLHVRLHDDCFEITSIENRSYCDKDELEHKFAIKILENKACLFDCDNNKIYESTIDNISELLCMTLSCIGSVEDKFKKAVLKTTNCTDYLAEAFEDYSGASPYIDDVLRKQDLKYCDRELKSYSMIHACLMMLAYKRKIEEKYNGYLFRGERQHIHINDKSYVEHGFTSLTYSIEVAAEFAGLMNYTENSRILAFRGLRSTDLIEMGEVAVCLSNGEASEWEVLMRAEMKISIHEQIGVYKGFPVFLATAEPNNSILEEIHYITKQFNKGYGTDDVYGIGKLIDNMPKLSEIRADDCYTALIKTKTGKTLNIDIDTDNFVVNDDIIDRKDVDNAIKSWIE